MPLDIVYHEKVYTIKTACDEGLIRGTEYCHRINPKAPRYTRQEKIGIRAELDAKEKEGK